jgi:hypothetical protein
VSGSRDTYNISLERDEMLGEIARAYIMDESSAIVEVNGAEEQTRYFEEPL